MIYYLYSKDNCQYCKKAEFLLQSKNLKYQTMKLGEDFTKEELLSWFPQAKTFPQIEVHVDGKPIYIGGFNELYKHLGN